MNGRNTRAALQTAWREIRACLERRRDQLFEEIRNYPSPITACDQQFNFLLEQRAKVAEELCRCEAHYLQDSDSPDSVSVLEEFLAASALVDVGSAARIQAMLAPWHTP